MNDVTLDLAAGFPAATREAWLALVEGVLKGADFEKRLVSRSYDGLRIEPLYAKAEALRPNLVPRHGPWRIAQRVDHPDPAAANALALADLEGGADALTLVFREATTARGFGLVAATVDDLDRALEGVRLDLIQVRIEAGEAGLPAAGLLADLADRRGHALAELDLELGLDPIGAAAVAGRWPTAWEVLATRAVETIAAFRGRGFSGRAFLADGRPFDEAGASEAQELAAVLAAGLEYLRVLERAGQPLEAARDALSFLLVAEPDQFLTIAKVRALRRLWTRVEEACGLVPQPVRLHAESAWRATTRRDPWVNLLRGTIAAFSAGVAGADAVTVLPFTAALGLPDAFARRLARNTQLILLEESNLWRVADPAAGSGGFEALTDALCGQAWELFQEIEREGGLVESLTRGALQARIARVRSERGAKIGSRKDPITGTSEFPDLAEAPVGVLMPAPEDRDPRPRESRKRSGPPGERLAPLPSLRLAEPFERLRDASDGYLRETGARPRVFLAALGPLAAFTARATFAKNAFEVGGIEAVTNEGFDSPDAVATAFAASGARVACLCSSDEIYAGEAVETARALKRAGAARLGLAGRPRDLEAALAEAGVDFYVFAGCDLPSALGEIFPVAADPAAARGRRRT